MKTGINRKKLFAYLIVVTVVFLLTYVMTGKELLPVHSDVRAHMKYGLSLDLVLGMDHGGWELLCWLCYACLPITPETAACMANGLFNAMTGALVLWLCYDMFPDTVRDEQKMWLSAAVSVSALLVGPLFLRFFNRLYYLGQGSPNPWHNPTFTGVRPFMILSTLLTIRYWRMTKEEKVILAGHACPRKPAMQILLAVLLAYSTFIKPSFLTIYLPACVVLVLMRLISYARFRCGRGKKDPQMPAGECSAGGRGGIVSYAVSLLVDHLYFVPSGLLLLRQYVLKFQTEEAAASSGVAIRLFKAAGRYTPSIALSWVLRMAFPAAVILIWHRSIRKNRLFWLILAEYVFGQLIAFVFTETGSRATHGNFGWGNLLGTSLIWIFCLVFFVQQYLTEGAENPATGSQKGPQGAASAGTGEIGLPSLCSRFGKWRWKYVLPALLLIWHLSAGIVYYVTLLHTPDLQL